MNAAGLRLASVVLTALCLAPACWVDTSQRQAETDGMGASVGGSDAGASQASLVASNGYVTAGPWAGYGFTATDPGAATIVPDCAGAAGCTPPFVGSDFCMHGTVTGRADFTGFAMLGWNVKQQPVAGAAMDTWAVPASGGVAVTVANPGGTELRLQLQGTNPHDSADRWCAPLISGQPIAWADFKTNCWTGGSPQNPLTEGTVIQQGAVLVPGVQADLPFDVCLVDIQVQP